MTALPVKKIFSIKFKNIYLDILTGFIVQEVVCVKGVKRIKWLFGLGCWVVCLRVVGLGNKKKRLQHLS